MLWIVASSIVLWLFAHDLRRQAQRQRPRDSFDLGYALALLLLFGYCVSHPYADWRFEQRMSAVASQLADGRHADFDCNSEAESIFFQGDLFTVATGSWDTGKIEILPKWCKALKRYIAQPAEAGQEELWSLNTFTHEAMHVRGERNETRTNCQAVQRNYRAARMLGVPDEVARRNAVDFYRNHYLPRANRRESQYYSKACAPGKALDEQLSDSTWTVLSR